MYSLYQMQNRKLSFVHKISVNIC